MACWCAMAWGQHTRFDHVVVATHGDQARQMLDDPDGDEVRVLDTFETSRNIAVLHTDASMMPRRRGVWSSWNYAGQTVAAGQRSPPCVTYWMNRLQNLPGEDIFLTLNPSRAPVQGQRAAYANVSAPRVQRRGDCRPAGGMVVAGTAADLVLRRAFRCGFP